MVKSGGIYSVRNAFATRLQQKYLKNIGHFSVVGTGECPFCYADFVSAVTSSFSSKVLLIASTRTCISKAKTNYHIHLVFCERKMLEQPEVKIATRNMFCDEQGKHRRTKKRF